MKHLEDEHQKALFKWAVYARTLDGKCLRDYLFAVPNGGYRKPQEAARLKGLGVTKGVPDVFCMLASQGRPYLPIEMKKPWADFERPRDALAAIQPEQRTWLERLRGMGAPGYVCYGWDEARSLLNLYMGVPVIEGTDFDQYTRWLDERIKI